MKTVNHHVGRVRIIAAAAMMISLAGCGNKENSTVGMSTQQIIAQGGTFQILLDNSGSSPATDKEVIAAALPLIVEKLTAMPLGTVVLVNSVGDASLPPISYRARIQKRASADGAPVEMVAQGVKRVLTGFPDQVAGHQHPSSHLIAGLYDASRNVNRASHNNHVIYISDLIENSPLAKCFQRITDKTCKLPEPSFDLKGVQVHVYGAGRGLPSDRAIGLTQEWDRFLKKAGAVADLHRTF